jgi:hypothetical protein
MYLDRSLRSYKFVSEIAELAFESVKVIKQQEKWCVCRQDVKSDSANRSINSY